MHLIKAEAFHNASASTGRVALTLLQTATKLSLGESLVPCVTFALNTAWISWTALGHTAVRALSTRQIG